MDAASILLILVAAGVNFGWQPADDAPDGLEYIVQVEPELLDALQHGGAVPIESNVPPNVGPIRKVSIVVGRDVPRTTAGAINRTSNFAGESAWTPDRFSAAPPAAASTYDRYGVPPGVSNSAVGPPPSVINRAQSAVTETGNTLREGVEAGIQAANQQLSQSGGQVLEATRDASQKFGRQLQGWATDPARQLQSTSNDLRTATERTIGTVGNQVQQLSNPFGKTSGQPAAGTRPQSVVAPPPWPAASAAAAASSPSSSNAISRAIDPTAAPGMTPAKTASGWTIIGTNVAAPPLLVPNLDTASVKDQGLAAQSAAVAQGPSFPAGPQAAANSTGADEWAGAWGAETAAAQATISRNGSLPDVESTQRQSNLVEVQPVPGRQNPLQATGGAGELWAEADRWLQSPQPTSRMTQPPVATQAATPSDAENWQLGGSSVSPPNTDQQSNQIAPGNLANNAAAPLDTRRQAVAATQTMPPASTDEPPWFPLLVVSLSLLGSLSANLFLGWSYMDARQKYRSLVRKTADTFRRAMKTAA